MNKTLIFFGILIIFSGCYNDKFDKLYPLPPVKPICDTTTITYTVDIAPIMNQYCNSCHCSGGSGSGDFTSCPDLQSQALNGNLLNDLYGTPTPHHKTMPPAGSPVPDSCKISKIARWVHQGALP